MPKIIGNPVGVPNHKSDLAQTDPTKADYVKNKKLSLFENDKGYLTVEDKQKFVKDVVNSIPHAENNSGEYGLVKLGTKSKGIDITSAGELQLLAATKDDINNNSTQLVVTRPAYFADVVARNTHRQMSDSYKVSNIGLSQYSDIKGYEGFLPVSYNAVKAYIDQIAVGKDGADGLTPFIGENGSWWIGITDTGVKAKGIDGKNGADGISCKHTWDGTKLVVTSASGTSSVDLKGIDGKQGEKGEDGYTPVKGVDYYTESDKEELINAVLAALPNGDEVSY